MSLLRLKERIGHFLWSGVVGVATLVFILEEWLWDTLTAAMGVLGRLPVISLLESWIARLPPAGAAVFFVLPTSLALPVKLVALHMIAHGHIVEGGLVIVAAKVLATALFARIYVLTQPALMQVRWFVALRAAVLRWRDWAYAQIAAHPLWRAMRDRAALWRARYAAWKKRQGRWRRRMRASQRLERMRRRGSAGAAPTSTPPRPSPPPPPRGNGG
jgi:hypothetical protein